MAQQQYGRQHTAVGRRAEHKRNARRELDKAQDKQGTRAQALVDERSDHWTKGRSWAAQATRFLVNAEAGAVRRAERRLPLAQRVQALLGARTLACREQVQLQAAASSSITSRDAADQRRQEYDIHTMATTPV